MIGPTGNARVIVATKPVDFRKGMEGLAMLVREHMKADPFSGAVYVFRAKRADRIKLIFWDGTGLCLFAKRLEESVFRWPKIEDGMMRLSAAELSALLEGLAWRRVHATQIGVASGDPDPNAARNRDHRRRSSSRTRCSAATSTSRSTRTRQPPSSISMIPARAPAQSVKKLVVTRRTRSEPPRP